MQPQDLINFLDQKAIVYEQTQFIKNDPISIPHLFKKKRGYRNFRVFDCYYFLGKSSKYYKKWKTYDGSYGL